MTPERNHVMHPILILSTSLLLLGNSVSAQDALGSGNALDANTYSGGTSNARVRELPSSVRNSQMRQNNLLQGRGFNEGIGRNDASLRLLADAEGQGEHEYQAALNNSPWYWNNWDQQTAQFLSQGESSYFNPNFIDNWSTAPSQMTSGRSLRSFSHEWSEESAQQYGGTGELEYPDRWSKRQADQYKLGQVLGSGALPNALDTTPRPVGVLRTNDTVGYLAASPLTGVSLEETSMPTSALGFSAWDEARIAEDAKRGIGQDQLVIPWRTEENTLAQNKILNQVDVSDSYNQVLKSVADRTSSDISDDERKTPEWIENEYAKLQSELTGIPYYGDTGDEFEEALDSLNTDGASNETIDDTTDEVAIEDIGAALRHGERITGFSGKQNTRFDELVSLGESELKSGNYFDAQRRFSQALQFIPGHPLATAGLGHSKIGSGLYLSAGYILQSLLTFQPEMIDATYGDGLLPPRIELVRAAVTVQNRLDVERDAGTYAFLLAYIGHQLGDKDMIENGLSHLTLHAEYGDPLVPLLTSIWLQE